MEIFQNYSETFEVGKYIRNILKLLRCGEQTIFSSLFCSQDGDNIKEKKRIAFVVGNLLFISQDGESKIKESGNDWRAVLSRLNSTVIQISFFFFFLLAPTLSVGNVFRFRR